MKNLSGLLPALLLIACARTPPPTPDGESVEWREMLLVAGVGSGIGHFPTPDQLSRDEAAAMIGECVGSARYTCAEYLLARFPELRGDALARTWPSCLHHAAPVHVPPLLERGVAIDGEAVEQVMRRADERDARLAIMALLADADAQLETRDWGGFTPLQRAAQESDADLVALLLRHGADAQARSRSGQTALDLARAQGAQEVVALLQAPPP